MGPKYDQVVEVDPPRPVVIQGYREHPQALLLRWVHGEHGWSEGWSAIVRYEPLGNSRHEVTESVRPEYLDLDEAEWPFALSSRSWTHDPETCVFCTKGPWLRPSDGIPPKARRR